MRLIFFKVNPCGIQQNCHISTVQMATLIFFTNKKDYMRYDNKWIIRTLIIITVIIIIIIIIILNNLWDIPIHTV